MDTAAHVKPRADAPAVRELTLQPDLAEVARAREFLREFGTADGLAKDKVFDITVACSEALANAIEHSSSKGQISLKVFRYPDRVEVRVEGPGEFHPPSSGRDRAHRGLGLPLMAYLSDHLALYSGPRGGTLVGMTFYREGARRSSDEDLLPPEVTQLKESLAKEKRLTRQLAKTNEALAARNQELKAANAAIVEGEKALRESEEHFRGLAEAMPQIVWTADAEGALKWFNQQWSRFTGRSPHDAEGWAWLDDVHADDREHTAARWRDSLRRQDTYQNEARIRRHDGSYRWFLVRAWPLRDSEGRVVQWFGTQTDVDEMKLAAEALRSSNEELQRFNRAAVDRELRMVELKREINALCVAAGKPPRYPLYTEQDG